MSAAAWPGPSAGPPSSPSSSSRRAPPRCSRRSRLASYVNGIAWSRELDTGTSLKGGHPNEPFCLDPLCPYLSASALALAACAGNAAAGHRLRQRQLPAGRNRGRSRRSRSRSSPCPSPCRCRASSGRCHRRSATSGRPRFAWRPRTRRRCRSRRRTAISTPSRSIRLRTGALYRLYAAPEQVSDIALAAGRDAHRRVRRRHRAMGHRRHDQRQRRSPSACISW